MSVRREESEREEWLRYAREDQRSAHLLIASAGIAPRETCVMAQQAAERALKAVLIAEGTLVPRSHQLIEIRNLLRVRLLPLMSVAELEQLSSWAVAGRYPGDWGEATIEDAERALLSADAIVAAAEERLDEPSGGAR